MKIIVHLHGVNSNLTGLNKGKYYVNIKFIPGFASVRLPVQALMLPKFYVLKGIHFTY